MSNHNMDDKRSRLSFAGFTDDMRRVIAEQRLAYVATVCPDGTPNLSPKGTIATFDDEHLVFADIRSPGTIRNLEWNPGVEINVVDPFCRKGYRFKGKAQIVRDGQLYQNIQTFYELKWVDVGKGSKELTIRCFVLVHVLAALTLVSPSYDEGGEEGQIRRDWIAYCDSLNKGGR
jgi:predicted pyridoxine 5'-phosphate oxidase superfamily flavin-nucleotide-binding protein